MASMNEKDYYAILGVDKDASTDEIRKAFQSKARKLHPDVNKAPDTEEQFKAVSEAYAVLSDPDKRRRYDAMWSGSAFSAPGSYQGGAAQGYPFSSSPFGWGFPFSDMGYGRRSGRKSRSYNPRAGADVSFQVDIDDETARKGTRRGVTYQRYAPCEACEGRGSVRVEHAETCPTCHGTGRIGVDLSGIFGLGVMEMECPECEGTGKVVSDPCDVCGGSGRVLTATELVVDIPAGSHDGDVVRVKGMGNAGTNGREAGDFVCRVGVPSERLTRQQASGFRLVGFGLPFAVLGAVTGTLASMAIFLVIVLGLGLYFALAGGVRHSGRWWRNALASLSNGAVEGLILALFMAMMFSCTAGRASFGGPGYGYVSG